jgi:hypothetical protein
VTVEVPDTNWRPDPDDLRTPPIPTIREEEPRHVRPPSPVKSVPRFVPYESPEVLEEITENLRNRVENWHGLDFSRYDNSLMWDLAPLTMSDSANYDFTAQYELAKTRYNGKN